MYNAIEKQYFSKIKTEIFLCTTPFIDDLKLYFDWGPW